MKFKDLKIGDKFTATVRGVKVDRNYAGVTTPTQGTNAFYVDPEQEVYKVFPALQPNRVITAGGPLGMYLGDSMVLWEYQNRPIKLCEEPTEEFYAYVCDR
jgi:hypothetical protein